ncbi:MAG: transglutaminase-like domain-containing protein [Prosthecobacter sp.]|nr:transglutaminase-like domain-containing protein [Prosthecobacter sp.]
MKSAPFFLFALISLPLKAQSPIAPSTSDTRGYVIKITNPNGVYPFEDYTCGSYSQRVTRESDTSVTIRTEATKLMPRPLQPYPLTQVPDKVAPYLKPTPRIQSDDPAIARTAQALIDSGKPQTQADVVMAVCAWTRKHMKWALPDEVPDALTCLKRQRGNCIGFSHLAAALLRNLGVPVRTMRVFVPNGGGGLTRHTLIEVYYPQDDLWVACDPQLGGRVFPNILYLFTDPDWSVEGQRKTRPFSVDRKTRVSLQSP